MHATQDDKIQQDTVLELGPAFLSGATFVLIAVVFGLILISNFGYYSTDDVHLIVQPSPSAEFAAWSLLDGRYVLAAATKLANLVGLDVVRDYSAFAAIYAVAFAVFVIGVVNYLTQDLAVSPMRHAVFCLVFALVFMTHGFMADLIAWKACFIVMILIFLIMTACLALLQPERMTPPRYAGLASLFLMLNSIYQPATMALFWLSLAWALVTCLGAQDDRIGLPRHLFRHVSAVASLFVLSGLGYIALTRIVFALTGTVSARPFDLANGGTFLLNLVYHAQSVISLLDPSGSFYGPYAGGPVVLLTAILACAVLLESALRSWFRLLVVISLVGCLLLFAQNPENILLGHFWPAGRNSFYVGFLPSVLWLAAWVAIRSHMRLPLMVIVFLVIDLQATMFAKLTAERFELRRRDYALATDIGDAIVRDATLVETTAISLPRYVPATHYRALVLPVFDSGVSAFDKLWSQAEIITLATGLKLTRVGTAACPRSERPDLISIRVSRDDLGIVVCF